MGSCKEMREIHSLLKMYLTIIAAVCYSVFIEDA